MPDSAVPPDDHDTRVPDTMQAELERMRLALESTQAGLYDIDLRTGRATCSARFFEIYGLDPAAPDSSDAARHRALLDEADAVELEQVARDALAGARPWSRVVRLTRANDGADRLVRVNGRTLVDDDGTPVRSVGTVRDVTDEERARRAVADDRRQLAEAQRVSGIGSWEWDIASNAVDWSEQTYRLLGYDPATTAPSFEKVLDVAYDETGKAAYLAALQDALAGARPYELDTRIRRPDGSVRYFHVRGEVIRGLDGTPRRMVGTMEDVTERRAAERALAEQESLLRTLAESSPVGIFLADASGDTVTYANPQLLALWEMSAEEFSSSWWSRIHPDDAALLGEARQRMARQEGSLRFAYRMRVGERVTHVRVTSAPVRDAMGSIAGYVGIVEDVTLEVEAVAERERLEAQVRQAQKLESIGVLAGGIAHDFNNLLVGILGTTSQAREEVSADAPIRPLLDDVLVTAERAADLTRQLLAYAGRGRLVSEPIELSALVADMQGIFRSIVARRARFTTELASGLAAVRGDPTQLRQVILNLVTNAVEALPDEQGLVTVRTFTTAGEAIREATLHFGDAGTRTDWLAIEVRDTGAGMERETLERIFDPFFSTKFTGRGLGLAATLGIVRSHGGVIAVQTAPGEGSRFTLLLPPDERVGAADDAHAVPAATPASPASVGGRLLVVDDDAMVRRVLMSMLTRRGYEVDEAANGVEAIRAVESRPSGYRAVLLDLTMPVLGGQAALRRIREIEPALPVVLMSGYSDGALSDDDALAGASAVLAKPFVLAAVEEAIARAVGG